MKRIRLRISVPVLIEIDGTVSAKEIEEIKRDVANELSLEVYGVCTSKSGEIYRLSYRTLKRGRRWEES